MIERQHIYAVDVTWTGNTGAGTVSYRGYDRDHVIGAGDKPLILGSSDPDFRGNPSRWNPEELLLASLSSCHQLWYLDLCARDGVIVTAYEDRAEGWMREDADGAGRFVRVRLRPTVTVAAGSNVERARALHHEAHAKCFIARSMNFPVETDATITMVD